MNFFKKIFLCSFLCIGIASNAFAAKPTTKKTIDKVAVVVNQDIVLLSEVNEFRKQAQVELKKNPEFQEMKPTEFDKRILDQMIEDKLVEQEIATLGLEATDSQVESVVDEVMKSNGLQTRRELERALKTEGLTYDEFVSQYKKRIARSNLVNQVIRPKIKISEDEIETEYKKRTNSNDKSNEYLVSMIFISSNSTSSKKMNDFRQTLHSLEDFDREAKKVSEGPAKEQGGNLGWIESSEIQEPLGSALKKMKKGDLSSVIETPAGYYILACLDQKTKTSKQSEKIKNEIQEDLMNTLLTKNLNQYIADLKRKAHIEIFI